MTQPRPALSCQECKWQPDQELTLGVVRAHYETEHPDLYKGEEDNENLKMHLDMLCPRCNQSLGDPTRSEGTKSGMIRHTYDCSNCIRTYTLLQTPPND